MPGAYELPLAALYLAQTGRVAGVACLGAVIRGETDHYDYVCAEAARGIQDVQLRTGVPCAFGVLTVESMEQALARSGGDHRDTGYHAGAGRAADGRAAGGAGVSYDVIGRTYTAHPGHRPAHRRGDLGGARRRAHGRQRGGGHRQLRAAGPRGHGGRAVRGDDRPARAGRRARRSRRRRRRCRSRTASFDAAMAVLTLHHWTDWRAGIEEMRRVARRVVVLCWDPSFAGRLWISAEYFPQLIDEDVALFPSLADQAGALRALRVSAVPIPHDCRDGFYGAHWRRPEAYLDPVVRAGISALAKRDPGELARGPGPARGRHPHRRVGRAPRRPARARRARPRLPAAGQRRRRCCARRLSLRSAPAASAPSGRLVSTV